MQVIQDALTQDGHGLVLPGGNSYVTAREAEVGGGVRLGDGCDWFMI